MPGRIRDADVTSVRERASIVDVIGDYVPLRSAGGGKLKGLCPFHDEKTPSFTVTPDLGRYYCFGCEAHGDAIDFLREMEHLDFREAVERLAQRAGVPLTYEQGGHAAHREVGQRQRLLDAHRAAAEFYAEQLATPAAAPGREFLASRGFDAAAAAHFGVGYAPEGWEALVAHLTGRGFSRDELLSGGLARTSSRGTVIDAFRGRLVWPIRDLPGDVVGFGARRLREDDPVQAKYLNTGDTPLFTKSRTLYGVDLAKGEIRRRYQAVVVEGYTDVMACHLAGVTTAVATCGTAFGSEHVKVLRRLLMDQDEFRGEVVFTFDGDAAGQKAAVRAFEDDQRFVAQTYVAVDPGGRDPCELRLAAGDAAVRDLVASRVRLFEYVIRARLSGYDLDSAEGRVAALAAAAPVVAAIRDRALRPEYARRLAGWLGMEVEPVAARVGELVPAAERAAAGAGRPGSRDPRASPHSGQGGGSGSRGAGAGPDGRGAPDGRAGTGGRQGRPGGRQPDDVAARLEREVLKSAVQHPDLAGAVFDGLGENVFGLPVHRQVRASIAAAGGMGGVPAAGGPRGWLAAVGQAAPDDEARALLTRLAVEPLHTDAEDVGGYVRAVLARVQEVAVTRQIVELKSKVQRLNPVTDEGFNRAFGELIALEERKRLLREQASGAL